MVAQERVRTEAERRAFRVLELVKDPEVPVLSIVELGVVRDVKTGPAESVVTVTITPTYSGCPAMHVIEEEIVATLRRAGFAEVRIETVYAPAWTTDWIGERAREKLRGFGIAPPGSSADHLVQIAGRNAGLPSSQLPDLPTCPHCGSGDTVLISEFGATACKSLHSCRSCGQPFERFKTF